jgi:hypothetical protein
MTSRTLFFSLILLTALIASITTASASVALYDDFSTDPTTNGNWVNVTNITWSSASQLVQNSLGDTLKTVTGGSDGGYWTIYPPEGYVYVTQLQLQQANLPSYTFTIKYRDADGVMQTFGQVTVSNTESPKVVMLNKITDFIEVSGAYEQYYWTHKAYYKEILTGTLLSRDITIEDINSKGNMLSYSGSPNPRIDILDKNGTVWVSNVASGYDLSQLTSMPDKFPIKLKVTLYDPRLEVLDYLQVIPNKYFGYVYDQGGKAVYKANLKIQHLISYSAPSYSGNTTSGVGNITLVVYKDGQPLSNALIKVTNPWGMNYISSSATDANGVINITGLDSQSGWTPTSNYTFQVFDLNANPVYDSMGNELKVTIPFIDGLPQTNPGIIYNSIGQDEETTINTDLDGYFEITTLNTSLTYHVTITDSNGNLLYEDDVSPPFYKVYGTPANGGGNNGGTGNNTTEPVYGDPNSKYYVELSSNSINEGDTVKIYVREKKSWWFDSYVTGAEIYLDGQPTGKTTQKHSFWSFLWWLPFVDTEPYAELQITSSGTHYIHAVYNSVKSQQASIEVLGNATPVQGGTNETGNYPGTQPITDPNTGQSYQYKLFADKTTLYQGGSVTFKVYKLSGGQIVDTVSDAMIYIDGNYAGTTGGWFNPAFKYSFNQPGQHKIYAVVQGQQTGELLITVLQSLKDKQPTDNGNLNLTVKVQNPQGTALSGIAVIRDNNGVTVEQKITNSDGEAILVVPSGTHHIVIADPSNKYLPLSKYVNVTADTSLTVVLKPAGDLNDNNQTDTKEPTVTSITVRVDGYDADNIELYKGKHNIEVVDSSGTLLSGASITLDDQPIGETSGWFFPKLTYDFQQPGQHTIIAEWNGMADTITITIKDAVDPNNPNAIVLLARPAISEGKLTGTRYADSFVIGNITVKKNQKVEFEVARQDSVASIWDWNRFSGAQIFVNGTPVGVTAKIGGILGTGLFGRIGYVHTFEQNGTFSVYAETTEGTTQTIYVTVGNETFTGDTGSGSLLDRIPIIGGILGDIAGSLAESYPLLGISTVDTLIYAIAIVLIALAVIVGILRWIF